MVEPKFGSLESVSRALPESRAHDPSSFPARRRALIVEDEILIALDLEAEMRALGFDVCGLAPSARQARSLVMSNEPDVVLMDVNLEACAVASRSVRHSRCLRHLVQ